MKQMMMAAVLGILVVAGNAMAAYTPAQQAIIDKAIAGTATAAELATLMPDSMSAQDRAAMVGTILQGVADLVVSDALKGARANPVLVAALKGLTPAVAQSVIRPAIPVGFSVTWSANTANQYTVQSNYTTPPPPSAPPQFPKGAKYP